MQTKIIRVTASDTSAINEATDIIINGGLVVFPTETVYGLGANAFNIDACHKIYEVKGRPTNKALTLHVASYEMIESVAKINLTAERLIKRFLPGPLTLILPKLESVPDFVTAGLKTVGIRMPDNDIALALIKAANCPIAAPSANLSGQPSPTTAQEVFNNLNGKIPMILDGGSCKFGVSSTIVDLTNEEPIILRNGVIDKSALHIGENNGKT